MGLEIPGEEADDLYYDPRPPWERDGFPRGKRDVVAARAPVDEIATLTGDRDIDQMLRDCISTMASKGAEYTVGSKDRLANFRGAAEDAGIPMEKCWYVFFNKHVRAVAAYIKNGCKVQSNEPISGRIMDCIVYLLLFHKMALEIEHKRQAAKEFPPEDPHGGPTL